MLRLLPEPAFLADAAGTLLAANEALASLSGVPAARLVGAPLETLVADPPGPIRDYLGLCLRSRQRVPGALLWRGPNGEPVAVRCDGGRLAGGADGAPALLFVQCRPRSDTTGRFTLLNRKIAALSKEIFERKRAEQQRDELLRSERQARLEAERVSRLKDEFLATLSHELRTPIQAILGWLHVLNNPASPPAGREAALGTIERNARAQARIVDDLLDMSRIISGKVQLRVQPVPLAAVLEAATESMRPAAQAKSLQLDMRLDAAGCTVRGDPDRLQQAVWNLLSNAVKFTPRGGRVQVRLEAGEAEARIVVSDSGEGIAPDFLPHVFDRFRQADASITRRHGGLGLGLSIVKQIVELHGGTARAESPGAGQGATLTLALPLLGRVTPPQPLPGGGAAAAAPPAPVECPGDCPSLQGLRVLVVDDEPDARELLRVLLENCGAEVCVADSAAEALERLCRGRFELLLSDIGMPGTDGCQLLATLRARPGDQGGGTPALALTALARPEDRARALACGFDGYLVKPIEVGELLSLAARFVPAASA
ncbi:ATP-binding protein [Caldimonas tepidiphila]|uniref:ATP-binding protein n=1 Tax=Caldimonas tepidiphila TaxID=2315841 RepID=UPI00196B066F|nr:PAS domain-containing hybrid sensor histidine kinase/response regulator [Caldimonas tepidiphila]